jgi:hypothetical protein
MHALHERAPLHGWWFLATFGSAILGGLIGLFLSGYMDKNGE